MNLPASNVLADKILLTSLSPASLTAAIMKIYSDAGSRLFNFLISQPKRTQNKCKNRWIRKYIRLSRCMNLPASNALADKILLTSLSPASLTAAIMQVQGCSFFLFLNQNICCGYSKEPSQWDGSFENPKQMLKLMDMKIFTIFIYLDVWIYQHQMCLLTRYYWHHSLPPHRRFKIVHFFLISQPKHMLWVLKRTVSMRRFFCEPKTNVKTYG